MEKIVCAANWYKSFPLIENEAPVGFTRPINCHEGIVFCGLRHHNCLHQMISITGKTQSEMGNEVQGFLTTRNRFVDRKEGALIWLAQGGTLEYSDERLFSEDLY